MLRIFNNIIPVEGVHLLLQQLRQRVEVLHRVEVGLLRGRSTPGSPDMVYKLYIHTGFGS